MTDAAQARVEPGSVFVEYPLRGLALWLWTAYLVLLTGAVASGVGFLLGLFALLGLVEESAFGPLGAELDLDGWSRSWVAIDAFVGVAGLGLLTAVAASARRVALRRRLDVAASRAGAESRVPVAWQRDCYTRDPLAAVSGLTFFLVVFFGVLFFVSVITSIVLLVRDDNTAAAWVFVAVSGLLTLVGVAAGTVVLRQDFTAGPAAALWGEPEVLTANAAAGVAEATGETSGARINHDSSLRMRVWLASKATRILAVAMGLGAVAVFVLAVIRKPGRFADERYYAPGPEAWIEVAWRVLLVAGAVIAALWMLGCVLVLLLDAARTARLLGRVSRDERSPRPSQSTLRVVLDGPSLGERVGLTVVALATIVGWAAWAAVIAAPPASDALHAATAWVWVCGSAALVGTAVVVGGLRLERPLRSGIREAWPLTEPEPTKEKSP